MAGDLEPMRMRDYGEHRQTADYLIDMGFAICGEEHDLTKRGGLWLCEMNESGRAIYTGFEMVSLRNKSVRRRA